MELSEPRAQPLVPDPQGDRPLPEDGCPVVPAPDVTDKTTAPDQVGLSPAPTFVPKSTDTVPPGETTGVPGAHRSFGTVTEPKTLYPRVLIDAMALRRSGRGVARSLTHLVPLLAAQEGLNCTTVTSPEGRDLLGGFDGRVAVAPSMPKSLWEPVGLPLYARRLQSEVIFSRSECGPLWGPPVLLWIPEDPYVRWAGEPRPRSREKLRRLYQRATMVPSIRRAPIVIASCHTTARRLNDRFAPAIRRLSVVPLGVDKDLFHPETAAPTEDHLFHLASTESRDRSSLVVKAYASARGEAAGLPDLVIAGDLGPNAEAVLDAGRACGVAEHVKLVGRVNDADLRSHYANAAICVQPSNYEGFGLQPLEALACAAVLLVSPEPAVEEVVAGTAVVSSTPDAAELGHEIARLWLDPGRRQQLRKAGPSRAAEFTWESTAAKLTALLLEIARMRRDKTP